MELIKDEFQFWDLSKIYSMNSYSGICGCCAAPVEYSERFYIRWAWEDDRVLCFIPLTCFSCPSCNEKIARITIYKTMNITDELQSIKNVNKDTNND
jgi:hypothetical protein